MYGDVAEPNECRELFELSGWNDTRLVHVTCLGAQGVEPRTLFDNPVLSRGFTLDAPAYDLAYLVRRLPGHYLQKMGNGSYLARWTDYAPTQEQIALGTNHLSGHSRTSPENALARLAIELFKAGVLLQPSRRR